MLQPLPAVLGLCTYLTSHKRSTYQILLHGLASQVACIRYTLHTGCAREFASRDMFKASHTQNGKWLLENSGVPGTAAGPLLTKCHAASILYCVSHLFSPPPSPHGKSWGTLPGPSLIAGSSKHLPTKSAHRCLFAKDHLFVCCCVFTLFMHRAAATHRPSRLASAPRAPTSQEYEVALAFDKTASVPARPHSSRARERYHNQHKFINPRPNNTGSSSGASSLQHTRKAVHAFPPAPPRNPSLNDNVLAVVDLQAEGHVGAVGRGGALELRSAKRSSG